eukprot:CAMPEP_0172318354 /NCGR_PEP_ID=MMETSP1058-20130122/34674_1 /TAXON_ID=83371 /ORGANISM="Detonula confervacea, Strain CCMP 353" /LENGTH=658 /DNA_ID=CAMNT_0013033179 /DNA_START=111 /DNA_END=2084 /DNA_ORIENTATION=-
MSQCHDRRQRQQQRPRRHLVMIGMLQLAIASTALTSAFTSPLSTTTTPTNFPVSTCGQRKAAVIMWAKKRVKRPLPMGDDEDFNYRESAKRYSNQDIDDDDKTDENDNASETEGEPKQTTLSGGTPLMFEMARRMLVWDDELYDSQIVNDAGSREEMEGAIPSSSSPSEPNSTLPSTSSPPPMPKKASTSLPRWRPSAIRQQSISNVNPSFRTSSPIMTNAGYASILRRNSRKKNKPNMWRHCLRVYSKMGELENSEAVIGGTTPSGVSAASDADKSKNEGSTSAKGNQIPGVGTNISPSANPRNKRRKLRVRRGIAHHEAALVAASKLGMWEEALLIYRGVESSASNGTVTVNGPNAGTVRKGKIRVTDNMILSVISACVKGSKVKLTASSTPIVSNAASDETNDDVRVINVTNPGNTTEISSTMNDRSNMTYVNPSPSRPMMRALTIEERRKPLDMVRDILLATEEKHDIPLVSRHINPLASAYNRLGLRSEAAALINGQLEDHVPPPPIKKTSYIKSKHWKEKGELTADIGFEPVEIVDWSDVDVDGGADDDDDEYSDGYEDIQLNVHQMKAKDRASYSLLVQGAAMEGNWTSAVQQLQRMTDAGLHPNSRNLNSWNEVMERGSRPSGNGDKDESDNDGGRQRRRSWKKKRDGIW